MNVKLPRVVITTSWDDDAVAGLKLAELLQACRMPGTFYPQTAQLGQSGILTRADVRSLADAGFEIGAHTVTHAMLTELSGEQLKSEVNDCRDTLEQITGRPVAMFCYPKGRLDGEVIAAVKRAGYQGARTVQMLCSNMKFDAFAMPTTLQAYPHRTATYVKNSAKRGAFTNVVRFSRELMSSTTWLDFGKKTFDRVLRDGGVWHLYGHAWELDRQNLWTELSELMEYVGAHRAEDVRGMTNGELLKLALTKSGEPALTTAAA